ncbi:hypothetical protein HOY82DRAFT_671777, partial [Tuber indicum]
MEQNNENAPEPPRIAGEYPPYLAYFLLSSATFGLWIFPWLPFISTLEWQSKLLLMMLFSYLTLTGYARSRWITFFAAQAPVVLWWWANRVPIFKLALLKILIDGLWHYFPQHVLEYGHIPLISCPLGLVLAHVYPDGYADVYEVLWRHRTAGVDVGMFLRGSSLGWPRVLLVLAAMAGLLVRRGRREDYVWGYLLFLLISFQLPRPAAVICGLGAWVWGRGLGAIVYVGKKWAWLFRVAWRIPLLRMVWVVLAIAYVQGVPGVWGGLKSKLSYPGFRGHNPPPGDDDDHGDGSGDRGDDYNGDCGDGGDYGNYGNYENHGDYGDYGDDGDDWNYGDYGDDDGNNNGDDDGDDGDGEDYGDYGNYGNYGGYGGYEGYRDYEGFGGYEA